MKNSPGLGVMECGSYHSSIHTLLHSHTITSAYLPRYEKTNYTEDDRQGIHCQHRFFFGHFISIW